MSLFCSCHLTPHNYTSDMTSITAVAYSLFGLSLSSSAPDLQGPSTLYCPCCLAAALCELDEERAHISGASAAPPQQAVPQSVWRGIRGAPAPNPAAAGQAPEGPPVQRVPSFTNRPAGGPGELGSPQQSFTAGPPARTASGGIPRRVRLHPGGLTYPYTLLMAASAPGISCKTSPLSSGSICTQTLESANVIAVKKPTC